MDQYYTLIISSLDLFGTIVFAVTGAMRGFKARLDFLGVVVLASAVGIGGGLIRDSLIGATPAAALNDERYLIVCIITGSIVFFVARFIKEEWRVIPFCDAIGLGVFTAIGAEKTFSYGLPAIAIALCGVLTAVGGGLIRDVMVMRIPAVLRSDFYATASLIGGILFCILTRFVPNLDFFSRFIVVSGCVFVIRLLAMRYKMHLPGAGDMGVWVYHRHVYLHRKKLMAVRKRERHLSQK